MAPAVPHVDENLSEVVATTAGTVRIDLSPERARVLARMVGAYSRSTTDLTPEQLEEAGAAVDVARILGSVAGWNRRDWMDFTLDLLHAAARIDQLDVPIVGRPVTTDTVAEALR